MYRVGFRLLGLCLALFALAPVPSASQTSGKSIPDQIREIISSDNGTVLKWTFRPKVAVVYDGRVGDISVTGILDQITREVDGFPGFQPVVSFDVAKVKAELFGNTRMIPRKTGATSGEMGFADIVFNSNGETLSIRSNMFVFFTSMPSEVLFGVLLSNGRTNSSLRGFAEGYTPCYYQTLSKHDEIQIAAIFIRNDIPKKEVETCLYEETTQALGLLEDSPDSPIFTYDERAEDKPDKRADFTLLRALYDESVKAGDSREEVVDLFMKDYFSADEP